MDFFGKHYYLDKSQSDPLSPLYHINHTGFYDAFGKHIEAYEVAFTDFNDFILFLSLIITEHYLFSANGKVKKYFVPIQLF